MDFSQIGGFDVLLNNIKPDGNIDLINLTFYIISNCCHLFHRDYVKELAPVVKDNIFEFLNKMSMDQLRNIKKETLESINKVLKYLLTKTLSKQESDAVLENFSINFSLRMIKTEYFDKRKQAVMNLCEIIKGTRGNIEKRKNLLKVLEENDVFDAIFGRNAHHQIISMSKEILELLLQNGRINDAEIEIICSGIKSGGNIEEKLTILKLLSEVSTSLSEKHISFILSLIYASKLQLQDMHKEEIDLIYALSTHYTQDEENLNKCLHFFVNAILTSKEMEGDKINHIINKVYDFTMRYSRFRKEVIVLCINSLEKVLISFIKYKYK